MRALEERTFLWLILVVSLAFGWILWPFFGAVLWGTVFAIVFAPVQRRLARAFGQRRSLAALATIAIIVLMVILPLTLITGYYGMNFEHMPELKWPAGPYLVLGVMVALSAALLYLFRRRKWM